MLFRSGICFGLLLLLHDRVSSRATNRLLVITDLDLANNDEYFRRDEFLLSSGLLFTLTLLFTPCTLARFSSRRNGIFGGFNSFIYPYGDGIVEARQFF